MPLPTLPQNPNPAQIAKFVGDTAEQVLDTLETSAGQAQGTLDAGARDAIRQLEQIAGQARGQLSDAAGRARTDIMEMLAQIQRLIGVTPADFAIGTVNGTPFFEPIGGLVLFVTAINANQRPIRWTVRDPAVISHFRDLAGNTQNEIAQRAREQVIRRIPALNTVGIAGVTDPASGGAAVVAAFPPVFWILVGVALIIITVAVGTAIVIFTIFLGLAILYAISKGYDIKDLKANLHTDWGGFEIGGTFDSP